MWKDLLSADIPNWGWTGKLNEYFWGELSSWGKFFKESSVLLIMIINCLLWLGAKCIASKIPLDRRRLTEHQHNHHHLVGYECPQAISLWSWIWDECSPRDDFYLWFQSQPLIFQPIPINSNYWSSLLLLPCLPASEVRLPQIHKINSH